MKVITTEFTRFFNDSAGRVIAEADVSGNVVSQIIWADKPLAIKKGSAYYYYIYNGHGDVVKLVDGSGTIKNTYAYDEWGNIVSKNETITNPIRYAAGYYDEESGMYYFQARYYDPMVGRFISEDSYEGDVTNPLSINPYIYCLNNPLIYDDESGHFVATILGALSGAVIDGLSAAIQGKDILTGIVSGATGGAIAGATVDITIATGGTALAPLVIGSAVGGGLGAMAGNALDQVGNRWKWGNGEDLSYIGSTLNYESMVSSGITGLGLGALSGYTGYSLAQVGQYGQSLFSNAATNALTYGNNTAVNNTINGIYSSAYSVSNSLLRADATFTSLYTVSSNLADYYVNPYLTNIGNTIFNYNRYSNFSTNYNYYNYNRYNSYNSYYSSPFYNSYY
ncbi:MAG: RHS repeat-associated core domain-containing protein [Dehalobacterium sp.]